MKKLIFIVAIGLFLLGCSGIKQSKYMEHNSHYKNWNHAEFSWWGYRNITEEKIIKSDKEKWWGIAYTSDTYTKH